MQRYFIITFLLLLFFSCKIDDKDDCNEFTLRGNLDTEEKITLTIEELTTSDLIVLDSITTDNYGNFNIKKEIDEAGFYILRISRDNFITLLVEPGEKIHLTGKADYLPTSYQVKGSEGSALLADLNQRLHTNMAKVDSLADLYRESVYEPNFEQIKHELNIDYTKIFEEHKNYVKQFIENNPKSLASLIALYQYFGNKSVLQENENFEYFESLSESLANVYPTNKHVVDLKKRVSEIKRQRMQRKMADEKLAIGNKAPEIVLPDPEGNAISLSSFRGKVVLIDFWASWHNPCYEVTKKLAEIYNKYKNQGFEIYGVSLDRSSEKWQKAIEENNINWTQVSDLRYFNSPVANLYNIQKIPYAILIDQEGKIVAKDVDYRKLNKYLEELL